MGGLVAEQPISSMTGPDLFDYLNILSQRQSEFSKIKINLIEELKPIESARSDKRAEIQKIVEAQRQTKIEISATKYALKASAEGLI